MQEIHVSRTGGDRWTEIVCAVLKAAASTPLMGQCWLSRNRPPNLGDFSEKLEFRANATNELTFLKV